MSVQGTGSEQKEPVLLAEHGVVGVGTFCVS